MILSRCRKTDAALSIMCFCPQRWQKSIIWIIKCAIFAHILYLESELSLMLVIIQISESWLCNAKDNGGMTHCPKNILFFFVSLSHIRAIMFLFCFLFCGWSSSIASYLSLACFPTWHCGVLIACRHKQTPASQNLNWQKAH